MCIRDSPYAHLGSLDARRLRGMVMLHGLASRANDEALAKDVRKWLVDATSDLSSVYHHNAVEVEVAPQGSSFRMAESAWVGWVRAELPRMTMEERAVIAKHLWVTDFRKANGDRDRFATYAFPGIDPMAFSFEAVDSWITTRRPLGEREHENDYFETVVCPATSTLKQGRISFSSQGRCDGSFYRWSLANRAREDVFVKGVLARPDAAFAIAVFYNAHRTLRDEVDYLRFLRRFEANPAFWKTGADLQRESVFRPSPAWLDESRRLWRDVPTARGHALFWFARHIDGSYTPQADWPDLLQELPADEKVLTAYLEVGWDAFELVPTVWPVLAKSKDRMRVLTTRARQLLDADTKLQPGGRAVPAVLAKLARVLCDEQSRAEMAELRAFAQAELPARPGIGLSEVIEATEPAECKPKARPVPIKIVKKKPLPPRVDSKGNDVNGNFVNSGRQ